MTEHDQAEIDKDQYELIRQLVAGQSEQKADHKHLDDCVDAVKIEVHKLADEITKLNIAFAKHDAASPSGWLRSEWRLLVVAGLVVIAAATGNADLLERLLD